MSVTKQRYTEIRGRLLEHSAYLKSRTVNGWGIEPEDLAKALLAQNDATLLMFDIMGRSKGFIEDAPAASDDVVIPAIPEGGKNES